MDDKPRQVPNAGQPADGAGGAEPAAQDGPPSQPSSNAVVGEILAEARQARDERRVRSEVAQERVERQLAKKRSQARKLYYLVPIFVLMTAGNLLMTHHSAPAISPQEEAASARMNLYMVAAAIEDYQVEHGRYPAALSQLGIEEPGIWYDCQGDTYSLSWETPAGTVEYTSGEGGSPLAAAVTEITKEATRP